MKLAYAAALLLSIPVYLPRLLLSFWMDEAGTFWMARDGFWAAIEKCSQWPGQSILYGALASLFCLEDGPLRDPLLRLPSVIGLGLLLFFTGRLATRIMGPWAGFCAFVLLLFHPMSMDVFVQARPYGLAAAAVAASYWFLYEWAETRERRFLAGYAVATLLIFYLHYLYVLTLVAHGIYLCWVFIAEKRRERWKELVVAWGCVAILLLPLMQHLRLLLRQSYTLPYADKPDRFVVLSALAAPDLVIGALVAGLLMWLLIWMKGWATRLDGRPDRNAMVLLVAWWIGGTTVLLLVSRLTPMHIFVPRYLGASAPADVLLLTAIGASVFSQRMVAWWAMAAVMVCAANPIYWGGAWKTGEMEALPAIQIVRNISMENPPPLFVQSSLTESPFLNWKDGPAGSYLFNELVAYPVANKLVPLPVRVDDRAQRYALGVLDGELRDAPVIVYFRFGSVPEWFTNAMNVRGYRMEAMRPNTYSVTVFRK